MKVIVDKLKCIGCGTCVAIAPGSFKLDGAAVTVIEPMADSPDKIKEAVESCPVNALTVEE
jgi:ferredoxin